MIFSRAANCHEISFLCDNNLNVICNMSLTKTLDLKNYTSHKFYRLYFVHLFGTLVMRSSFDSAVHYSHATLLTNQKKKEERDFWNTYNGIPTYKKCD